MIRLRRTANASHCEEGYALVEAAVALPVFCLLIFGISSFAIVLFGWCNITYASRAAARYASIHSNTSLVPATGASITAVVTPFLFTVSPGGSTTTVAYTPASSNVIGATVAVTVTANYSMTLPFSAFHVFTVASTAQRTITR